MNRIVRLDLFIRVSFKLEFEGTAAQRSFPVFASVQRSTAQRTSPSFENRGRGVLMHIRSYMRDLLGVACSHGIGERGKPEHRQDPPLNFDESTTAAKQ